MSTKTEWSSAAHTAVEVVGEHADQYGSRLNDGAFGLVLSGGGTFVVVEGTPDELEAFAHRILRTLYTTDYRALRGDDSE